MADSIAVGLLLKAVDGRGQEAVRQGRRRVQAFADGLGEILLEVGKDEATDRFGNKGGHCCCSCC